MQYLVRTSSAIALAVSCVLAPDNASANVSQKSAAELENAMKVEMAEERGEFPTNFEILIDQDWEWKRTTIKIPYSRCAKERERISFDIPRVEWGVTKFLGIKMHLPKIYRKRVDIKFDYPRCSKDYKEIKLDLPQVKKAKKEVNTRSDNMRRISEKYAPLIKAAHIREAKDRLTAERNKIVAQFKHDISVVDAELKTVVDKTTRQILNAQKRMLEEMQAIVLADFDKKVSSLG